jgi:hypothetical protein
MPLAVPIRRRAVTLCTALSLALALARPARCVEPVGGVIVLRNGNVLEGSVSRGDGYYVVEHQGASLQVPADQVERACASLVEAYELRRQERVGASADSHLELARWCVRNQLLDQAAREVLDARVRDPGHPRIADVEMQIRQALEIEAARRARAHQVQTTSFNEPAEYAAATLLAPLVTPSIEAQTQFVRSIQPMLVQSCAVGGCHQPSAPQKLQLDRWALEGNGNPDLIRRNLDNVLSQIDAADPASSPLIIRARKAHGNARAGLSKPLTSYQAAIVLDWLNAAAGVTPAPTGDPAAPVDSQLEPEPIDETAATSTPTGQLQPPTRKAFTPRDPFDPEIFNRQIAPSPDALESTAAAEPAGVPEAELDAIGDAVESAATQSAAE